MPEEESSSLILQPWPLAISSSHRPDTHKHTHTLTHTMCRPDQSLTACTDPHYTLKYVSGPFFPNFHNFSSSFCFLPHFSRPLSPLSPNFLSFLPCFLRLSVPCEIRPAGLRFFLLSSQITNPRERKRSSWFYTTRGRDGWIGG